LKAMTIWAAYQYFEENTKGSITQGKLADFVVLSGNPLTVPRNSLDQLKVLDTVKEGNIVYQRPSNIAITRPDFGTHGDPTIPASFQATYKGDGDFGPALEAIYERLYQQ